MPQADPQRNDRLRKKATANLDTLIAERLGKPFHGVLTVSVHMQDGAINHLKSNVEAVDK